MDKIKDFMYNISDILVTIIIIAVAALLISWRVSAIVAYPNEAIIQSGGASGAISGNSDASEEGSGSDDGSGGNGAGDTNDADGSGGSGSEDGTAAQSTDNSSGYTITVSTNESSEQIAQNLVNAGILPNTEDFLAAVEWAGASTRLKAGTYHIPAGATADEIVIIMTS